MIFFMSKPKINQIFLKQIIQNPKLEVPYTNYFKVDFRQMDFCHLECDPYYK
jgi:hypothetical protein